MFYSLEPNYVDKFIRLETAINFLNPVCHCETETQAIKKVSEIYKIIKNIFVKQPKSIMIVNDFEYSTMTKYAKDLSRFASQLPTESESRLKTSLISALADLLRVKPIFGLDKIQQSGSYAVEFDKINRQYSIGKPLEERKKIDGQSEFTSRAVVKSLKQDPTDNSVVSSLKQRFLEKTEKSILEQEKLKLGQGKEKPEESKNNNGAIKRQNQEDTPNAMSVKDSEVDVKRTQETLNNEVLKKKSENSLKKEAQLPEKKPTVNFSPKTQRPLESPRINGPKKDTKVDDVFDAPKKCFQIGSRILFCANKHALGVFALPFLVVPALICFISIVPVFIGSSIVHLIKKIANKKHE